MGHGSGSAHLSTLMEQALARAFGRQAFDLPERRNRFRGRGDVRSGRRADQGGGAADRAVARLPGSELQRGADPEAGGEPARDAADGRFVRRGGGPERACARGPAHNRDVAAAREHLAPALHPPRPQGPPKARRRFSPAPARRRWLSVAPMWAADCIRGFHFRELHHFWLTYRRSYTVRKWPMLRNLFWRYGTKVVLKDAGRGVVSRVARPLGRPPPAPAP